MPWTFIIRPRELRKFRRCRREWDLGSQVRQRYAQKRPSMEWAFDKAIRDALAVYYFPAMDDWNRAIVRPLTLKGFDRSMRESPGDPREVDAAHPGRGEDVRGTTCCSGRPCSTNYFVWAAALDDFDSIFADHDIWAPMPDPASPMHDLGTLDGRPMRYMGRMDQLIADPDDELWIVEHRVVRGEWTDSLDLIEDEVLRSHCWHTQIAYPQMLIAGTIINELRVDGQLDAPPVSEFVERDQRTMIGSRHVQHQAQPAHHGTGGHPRHPVGGHGAGLRDAAAGQRPVPTDGHPAQPGHAEADRRPGGRRRHADPRSRPDGGTDLRRALRPVRVQGTVRRHGSRRRLADHPGGELLPAGGPTPRTRACAIPTIGWASGPDSAGCIRVINLGRR